MLICLVKWGVGFARGETGKGERSEWVGVGEGRGGGKKRLKGMFFWCLLLFFCSFVPFIQAQIGGHVVAAIVVKGRVLVHCDLAVQHLCREENGRGEKGRKVLWGMGERTKGRCYGQQ